MPFLQGDAFKTLFVSRISFETTEKKLKREFEEYGPIKRLRMVQDATGILLCGSLMILQCMISVIRSTAWG